MEALSGSASLDDFVTKIEAADWAGCDARAFARAAAEKLLQAPKSHSSALLHGSLPSSPM